MQDSSNSNICSYSPQYISKYFLKIMNADLITKSTDLPILGLFYSLEVILHLFTAFHEMTR